MALPNNRLSAVAVPGDFVYPENLPRPSKLVDYELGGIALYDPSQGLQVQAWRARVDGADIKVGIYPVGAETVILTAAGTSEISLGFDQNMNPTLAYLQAGVAKLYWFDTLVGSYVITQVPGARSPFCTLDDHRDSQTAASDVLFLYLVGGELRYRQQRERFSIERVLKTGLPNTCSISQAGLARNLRFQILIQP